MNAANDDLELQATYAEELADEMMVCGHEVSTLDILDCLASCGLTLFRGIDPVLAYQKELGRG